MPIRALALVALLVAGCRDTGPEIELGVPLDLSVPRDASAPQDSASASSDLAALDQSVPPEDGLPCSGGYLNSDAGNACPLACSPLVEPVPDEGRTHIWWDMLMTYQHNPPASGDHWPSPAPWGRHDEIVPPEWWIHNLEHGGIVLLYNCPPGTGGVPNSCADVIAAFTQLHDTQPPDNWYDMFTEVRILITPDPTLPIASGATRSYAAVAWDWSYVSDANTSGTVDTDALSCFINARYGRGPENAP
jgi:hypothetical protein